MGKITIEVDVDNKLIEDVKQIIKTLTYFPFMLKAPKFKIQQTNKKDSKRSDDQK